MNAGRLNDGEETSNAGLIHPSCCLIRAYANSDPSDLPRPRIHDLGVSVNTEDELLVSQIICRVVFCEKFCTQRDSWRNLCFGTRRFFSPSIFVHLRRWQARRVRNTLRSFKTYFLSLPGFRDSCRVRVVLGSPRVRIQKWGEINK